MSRVLRLTPKLELTDRVHVARAGTKPPIKRYKASKQYATHRSVFLGLVSDQTLVNRLHNPFPAFPFTGSVRPVYPLSPRRALPGSIKRPDWAETGIPARENRLNRSKIELLDAKAQDAMRKVCRLAREVLDITAAELTPGITTDYLDEVCHRACVERDVSMGTLFILIVTNATRPIRLP